jgi:hypothetical protein
LEFGPAPSTLPYRRLGGHNATLVSKTPTRHEGIVSTAVKDRACPTATTEMPKRPTGGGVDHRARTLPRTATLACGRRPALTASTGASTNTAVRPHVAPQPVAAVTAPAVALARKGRGGGAVLAVEQCLSPRVPPLPPPPPVPPSQLARSRAGSFSQCCCDGCRHHLDRWPHNRAHLRALPADRLPSPPPPVHRRHTVARQPCSNHAPTTPPFGRQERRPGSATAGASAATAAGTQPLFVTRVTTTHAAP